MKQVHLRRVTPENYEECIRLSVTETQIAWVASNLKSLDQATANPTFFPLAIYDRAALGWLVPPAPMIGFTMYEMVAGVGFIVRLMIDQKHQRQGYGQAATMEIVRRLKLMPEVELIATSHRDENEAAAAMYREAGFVECNGEFGWKLAGETFLKLHTGGQN